MKLTSETAEADTRLCDARHRRLATCDPGLLLEISPVRPFALRTRGSHAACATAARSPWRTPGPRSNQSHDRFTPTPAVRVAGTKAASVTRSARMHPSRRRSGEEWTRLNDTPAAQVDPKGTLGNRFSFGWPTIVHKRPPTNNIVPLVREG